VTSPLSGNCWQNKHIPGSHNYQPGKSVITISSEELEILVEKHKGTGQFIKNQPLQPDFRERIDFGKTIGIFVDVENPGVQVPTEIGMMVYDKQGKVHVIPVRPKIKVTYE
jgi:hypothetical protein